MTVTAKDATPRTPAEEAEHTRRLDHVGDLVTMLFPGLSFAVILHDGKKIDDDKNDASCLSNMAFPALRSVLVDLLGNLPDDAPPAPTEATPTP